MADKWEVVVGLDNEHTFVYKNDEKQHNFVEAQFIITPDERYVKLKYIDMDASKERRKLVMHDMTLTFDECRLRYSL